MHWLFPGRELSVFEITTSFFYDITFSLIYEPCFKILILLTVKKTGPHFFRRGPVTVSLDSADCSITNCYTVRLFFFSFFSSFFRLSSWARALYPKALKSQGKNAKTITFFMIIFFMYETFSTSKLRSFI